MKTSLVSERVDGVWCVQTNVPGPRVAFVGGVHGNERAGITVVQQLVHAFQSGARSLERGTLSLALGNLEAIAENTRATTPTGDLNRCFGPGVMQRHGSSYETRRARELAIALQRVEIGIDLHATNLPSTPFLMTQTLQGKHTEAILPLFQADIVLTDPHWVFAGGPCTLDEFFGRGRRTGICYETGFAADESRVTEIEAELLDLLRRLQMIEGPSRPMEPAAHTYYELVQALVPKWENFQFCREPELRNFLPIQAGELLGDDAGVPIRAEYDGILVFPKAQHLRVPGKPVGYLARCL